MNRPFVKFPPKRMNIFKTNKLTEAEYPDTSVPLPVFPPSSLRVLSRQPAASICNAFPRYFCQGRKQQQI